MLLLEKLMFLQALLEGHIPLLTQPLVHALTAQLLILLLYWMILHFLIPGLYFAKGMLILLLLLRGRLGVHLRGQLVFLLMLLPGLLTYLLLQRVVHIRLLILLQGLVQLEQLSILQLTQKMIPLLHTLLHPTVKMM